MKPLITLSCIVVFLFTISTTAKEKISSENLITASGTVKDSLTAQTLSNAKIVLYDINKEDFVNLKKGQETIRQNTKMHKLKSVSTNESGEYTIEMLPEKCYKLIVTINGFISQTKLFSTEDTSVKEREINFNLENQEVYVDKDSRVLMKIDPIQFEINSTKMTAESKRNINKVILLLYKYPDFEIEIGVHASSLGGDSFNLNLTTKRADEIYKYINSSKWPNKDRLTAVGYGEAKLINECVNGAKCSRSKHLENKRVEFVLKNKYKPISDMEYLTRRVSSAN
ncbi:OmpA family protein [Lutibacter citreus]|uniref:OmpA family protein n=1 Tax=Lutibacter citreus TaxID=2138210 RepID=UPI000DBE7D39|nr:OmpA family protein [Lutibacter citreus]